MIITTVMATLNAADTLERALESFAIQDYPEKELIVIDGNSSDDTITVLNAYSSVITEWVSAPDNGILHAWNKGLIRATGDWIHFLGADDYYLCDDVFARFARVIDRDLVRSKIYYGRIRRVDSEDRVIGELGEPWDPRRFRRVGFCIPHQGVFHHRSLFDDYGAFETGEPFYTYEFLLRYLKDHDAVFMPNLLVAGMGTGGVSSNPDYQLAFRLEYRRAQRLHGTVEFSLEAWLEMAKAAFKLLLRKLLPDRASLSVIDAMRRLLGKTPMWTR